MEPRRARPGAEIRLWDVRFLPLVEFVIRECGNAAVFLVSLIR